MSLINKMLADLETRAAENQRVDDNKPLIDGLKAANEDSHGLPRARRKWWLLGIVVALLIGAGQWWPMLKERVMPQLAALKMPPVVTPKPAAESSTPTENAAAMPAPHDAIEAGTTATPAVMDEHVPVPQMEQTPPRVAGLVEFLDVGPSLDDEALNDEPFNVSVLATPTEDKVTTSKMHDAPAPPRREAVHESAPKAVVEEKNTAEKAPPAASALAEIRVHRLAPSVHAAPEEKRVVAPSKAIEPAPMAAVAEPAPEMDVAAPIEPPMSMQVPAPVAPVVKEVAPIAAVPKADASVASPSQPERAIMAPPKAVPPIASVAPVAPVKPIEMPVEKPAPTQVAAANRTTLAPPVPSTPDVDADRGHRRAQQLAAEGRMVEAEAQWRDNIARYPRHVDSRTQLALYYARQKRVIEAQSLLEDGLSVAPELLSWRMLLARIYVDHNAAERAAGVLERGQASGATNADYWGLRAAVAQQLGRSVEAAAAFEQATRLQPQEGRWWIGMAIGREAAGDSAGAVDAYERALRAERFPPALVNYAQQRLAALRALKTPAK